MDHISGSYEFKLARVKWLKSNPFLKNMGRFHLRLPFPLSSDVKKYEGASKQIHAKGILKALKARIMLTVHLPTKQSRNSLKKISDAS